MNKTFELIKALITENDVLVSGSNCNSLSAWPEVMVKRPEAEIEKMNRRQEKFIHVGNFVDRVEVDLVYTEGSWSPCLTLEDARILDKIRMALQKGDIKAAAQNAQIFQLTPVTKAA